MNRRVFLKRAACGILTASSIPLISCNNSGSLRFGIVTDIHYSERESYDSRYFKDSIQKLQDAIHTFRQSDLDFLIELGDFKDQDATPDRDSTLAYLDTIEEVFQSFNGPVYHVLGNHDMDSISKEDFLQRTTNYGKANKKSYYSFTVNRIRCIVLDANFNEDGSSYDSGNFDWTKAYVSGEQVAWLREELSDKKPTIVFIHQLLDDFSDIYKAVCVDNASEVVSILENSGCVLAVFQGHHHAGHYSFRNDIHYWTMKGMIEGNLPENNSFAIIEVDKNQNIYIDGFANCEDKALPRLR